jgi:hypothetical protein
VVSVLSDQAERCQPHQARIVMCGLFDTTVMLGDGLAGPEPSPLPQPVVQWLTTNAWKQHRGDWYCDNHAEARGGSGFSCSLTNRANDEAPGACRDGTQRR